MNINIHKPETCACIICGQQTIMLGTKLCGGCWEATSHNRLGFIVLNSRSASFCHFKTFEAALEFYNDGIQRKEPYSLLSLLKGTLPYA